VELPRRHHPHVVTGAAADQRHGRAENAVRAADHLLLVAGERVGQHDHHAVPGGWQRLQRRRQVLADLAWLLLQAGRTGGPDREVTAQADNHDTVRELGAGADLARRGAADDRDADSGLRDAAEQFGQVVAERGEDDQQPRVRAVNGIGRRGGAGGSSLRTPRVGSPHPAAR
jgi:hypothetical protein